MPVSLIVYACSFAFQLGDRGCEWLEGLPADCGLCASVVEVDLWSVIWCQDTCEAGAHPMLGLGRLRGRPCQHLGGSPSSRVTYAP